MFDPEFNAPFISNGGVFYFVYFPQHIDDTLINLIFAQKFFLFVINSRSDLVEHHFGYLSLLIADVAGVFKTFWTDEMAT